MDPRDESKEAWSSMLGDVGLGDDRPSASDLSFDREGPFHIGAEGRCGEHRLIFAATGRCGYPGCAACADVLEGRLAA